MTILHNYTENHSCNRRKFAGKVRESIMKSIIWKIELAAAVLLAVSALVWGLRPGVWNYGGFYRMAAGEQGRTYTRPG